MRIALLALLLYACTDAAPGTTTGDVVFVTTTTADIARADGDTANEGPRGLTCSAECFTDDDCGVGRACRVEEPMPSCIDPSAPPPNWFAARAAGFCRGDDDCPVLQACAWGRAHRRCVALCGSDDDCPGAFCKDGRCVPCLETTSPATCPIGTQCGVVQADWSICVARCHGDDDCAWAGYFCTGP